MRITIPATFDDFERLGRLGQTTEFRDKTERDVLCRIFRAGLTAIERNQGNKKHGSSAAATRHSSRKVVKHESR